MADLPERPKVLLGRRTPREKAIGAADGAVNDLDTDLIRRAGSPDIAEVPAAYLPARAQARSVDVWDPVWPEAVKRAAIVAAPRVHRRKGSAYAVKTALTALGIGAEVVEWWQTSPRGEPYTFHVTAFAQGRLYDGPILNARLIRVVDATIRRNMPLTRAYDLAIGIGFAGSLGLAPAVTRTHRVAAAVHPDNREDFASPLGLAPVAVATQRIALTMIGQP